MTHYLVLYFKTRKNIIKKLFGRVLFWGYCAEKSALRRILLVFVVCQKISTVYHFNKIVSLQP